MAASAIRTEGTVVGVVLGMAATAAARQLDFSLDGTPVTGVAVDLPVRTPQREARLLIVIELPDLPAVRVVTQPALRPEPPEMDVLLAVAAVACDARILVARRRVALLAGGDGVEAQQRETREIVLEEDAHGPTSLVVAGVAAAALLSSVNVVRPMAGGALR